MRQVRLKETKSCQNAVIVTKDGKKDDLLPGPRGCFQEVPRQAWVLSGHQGRPDQGQGHRHRREERRQADDDRREDRERVSSDALTVASSPAFDRVARRDRRIWLASTGNLACRGFFLAFTCLMTC